MSRSIVEAEFYERRRKVNLAFDEVVAQFEFWDWMSLSRRFSETKRHSSRPSAK